ACRWHATWTSSGWAMAKAATVNDVPVRGNPSITSSVSGPNTTPWRRRAIGKAIDGYGATAVFASNVTRRRASRGFTRAKPPESSDEGGPRGREDGPGRARRRHDAADPSMPP